MYDGGDPAAGLGAVTNQTFHNKRCSDSDASRDGDLLGLLALLNEPAGAAMYDDGLHRLATSVAALRRGTAARS